MAHLVKPDQKQKLIFLANQPQEVLVDFCKLAFDYLNNGPNEKRFAIAADKLNSNLEEIQSIIEGLVCFLIDCTKSNVTESDFESMKILNFSPEQISILWQFVTSKTDFLQTILKNSSVKNWRFRDLEWRLEGKIASRSLHNQAVPLVTMKLHLDTETINENRDILMSNNPTSENDLEQNKSKTTKRELIMQVHPTNLVHIIEVLEQALLEAKTHRTRNFIKAIQQ